MKRLLLMSSSRKGSMGYLEHATAQFDALLKGRIGSVLFVPYAGVSSSYDAYEGRVKPVFDRLGIALTSIHRHDDPVRAVGDAEAIAVGGGNTFALLKRLYDSRIVEVVRERVNAGLPYIGWSAGANVACPTIRTTNDMPIVAPPSFDAFNLVPFQINPHFIAGKPPGHNGESREDRLTEYLAMNPGESVLALREGSALLVEGDQARLMGDLDALVFRAGAVETLAPDARFPLSQING